MIVMTAPAVSVALPIITAPLADAAGAGTIVMLPTVTAWAAEDAAGGAGAGTTTVELPTTTWVAPTEMA